MAHLSDLTDADEVYVFLFAHLRVRLQQPDALGAEVKPLLVLTLVECQIVIFQFRLRFIEVVQQLFRWSKLALKVVAQFLLEKPWIKSHRDYDVCVVALKRCMFYLCNRGLFENHDAILHQR